MNDSSRTNGDVHSFLMIVSGSFEYGETDVFAYVWLHLHTAQLFFMYMCPLGESNLCSDDKCGLTLLKRATFSTT
jgi:hypothetical protein